MANTLEIKRDIGRVAGRRGAVQRYDSQPLTWWPLLPDSATFVCSKGHFGRLTEHTIAADGAVSPSVECFVPGCGFHENIKLIGWKSKLQAAV